MCKANATYVFQGGGEKKEKGKKDVEEEFGEEETGVFEPGVGVVGEKREPGKIHSNFSVGPRPREVLEFRGERAEVPQKEDVEDNPEVEIGRAHV